MRASARPPRIGLVHVVVLLLTAYALGLDLVTFASNDYRSILLQSVGFAALASILAGTIWRRVPKWSRVELALCMLVNLFTLVDAGGRRLPAVMGW